MDRIDKIMICSARSSLTIYFFQGPNYHWNFGDDGISLMEALKTIKEIYGYKQKAA